MPTRDEIYEALDTITADARNYRFTFGTPTGQRVLADLAAFCRATESCFDADPRMHAVAEGRREVWLRIQRYLNLTPDQLFKVFNKITVQELMPKEE